MAYAFAAWGMFVSVAPGQALALQKEAEQPKNDLPIVELSKRITESLVKIRVTNRDERSEGHGSGFVIGNEGLIATARHVIGDRKHVTIELPDGTEAKATHVYASSDAIDVAILKIDSGNLQPLPLGEVSETQTGQSVVTVGHPGSLKNSTFTGILSGFKEIDDIEMLQLSMTIEQGSSGEPVVDRRGNVIGVVVLKSAEVANLGFAIPVSYLKEMLDKPTPIPMSHWMKIGALDESRWDNVFGANWSQRAGRIMVDGQGDSFGGRSLCLQKSPPPEFPYEVQVEVKLADERGAAGLAFHADGNEKHYGFYPSNGNIRLTQFNGPDLGSWTILHNEPHPAYRDSEWNTFKVRIEKDGFQCFLNDVPITKSSDDRIPPGRIGLATFRGTAAEFRKFQAADRLPSLLPKPQDADAIASILNAVKHNRPATDEVIQQLQPYRRYSTRLLEEQALKLEQQAKRIRQLSKDVHASDVRSRIRKALNTKAEDSESPESMEPDLLRCSMLIALLDNEEVETDVYLAKVSDLAAEVKEALPQDASEQQRLDALDKLLFEQYGFSGSRYDYDTRANSYLNEVIDDRRGIPITLSVLYMEIARRLDLKVVGLGLPGHYVVRFEPSDAESEPQIIDVFHRGKRIPRTEAEAMVRARGFRPDADFFRGQNTTEIIHRMLLNLLNLAESERDNERVLRYLDTLIAIDENDLNSRVKRLEIRARTDRLTEAISDVDWFLKHQPSEVDTDRLHQLRAELQRQEEAQKLD